MHYIIVHGIVMLLEIFGVKWYFVLFKLFLLFMLYIILTCLKEKRREEKKMVFALS